MDVSSGHEGSNMEESSGPKSDVLRKENQNGGCTMQLENISGEDAQNTSTEAKVEDLVSLGAKILRSPQQSTKLQSSEELRNDGSLHSPIELQAESFNGIFLSSELVTVDQNCGFGSDIVNYESIQENHVIDTDTTNAPIKYQESESDHINMEEKGIPIEEVTPISCLKPSTVLVGNQPRRCISDQLGLSLDKTAKGWKLIQSGQQIDNASKNAGLAQLGPGHANATRSPSPLEDMGKRARGRPKRGQDSLTSSGGSAKALPEKKEYSEELSVSWSSRLRSKEKSILPDLGITVTEEGARREKKNKKGKKLIEKNRDDEFSRIRKNLRYFLHRIKYEKNFIDAYVGEGWRGQSLEKIKPEKELQRAKAEIFRRKLKIRDLFHRLDLSCAEGRIPETLFDSEGEIDSEDIFCAKCGSKDVTLSNDIILCDGACERGFHQFCLDPPLLKEHIPADDEGWLCPGCDCKVDCIELLNDSELTNISVGDNWEKVFSVEAAAAAAAAGKNLDDNSGLPSDDSEDDDYDPDGPDLDDQMQGDKSSSDESDYAASDDLQASTQKEQFLGLPSDDSEDDDFDPCGLDSDQKVKEESSSSDFTSDSEDLTVVVDDSKPSGEVQGPMTSTSDHGRSNEKRRGHSKKRDPQADELLTLLESDHGKGDPAFIYPRRQVKRLDYRKLHDEEYGSTSSDSSDEDFMDTQSPKKGKNSGKEASVLSNVESPKTENVKEIGVLDLGQKGNESTPKRRRVKKIDVEGTNSPTTRSRKDSSPCVTSGKSTSRTYGEEATQRLLQSFKENQYPARAVKESLATELALKVQQVNKWFENARWSFRHSSNMASKVAEIASTKGASGQESKKLHEPEPKSVSDNASCSGVVKKNQDKASPRMTRSCSKDATIHMVAEEGNEDKYQDKASPRMTRSCSKDATIHMVAEEGNEDKSSIRRSSKRKANFGSEATEPNTSSAMPKKDPKANSPKIQEVRKSSRLQSKNT